MGQAGKEVEMVYLEVCLAWLDDKIGRFGGLQEKKGRNRGPSYILDTWRVHFVGLSSGEFNLVSKRGH